MFGFVSTLLKFYFLLFVVLSHTSIMSCRFGELKVDTREYDWRIINQQLVGKCHKVINFKLNSRIASRVDLPGTRVLPEELPRVLRVLGEAH